IKNVSHIVIKVFGLKVKKVLQEQEREKQSSVRFVLQGGQKQTPTHTDTCMRALFIMQIKTAILIEQQKRTGKYFREKKWWCTFGAQSMVQTRSTLAWRSTSL